MNKNKFSYVYLIFCLGFLYVAGCASLKMLGEPFSQSEVEKAINDKRWEDVENLAKGRSNEPQILAIVAFLKEFDICSDIQSSNNDEVEQCYENLMANQWARISSFKYQYVGLMDSSRKDQTYMCSVQLWNELVEKHNLAETRIEKEKQKNCEKRNAEREWENEADKLYSEALEKALDVPKYLIQQAICTINDGFEEKREIEKAIDEEKRYSNKYGVMNLTKIDVYKQQIIQLDQMLHEWQKKYRKYTGNSFKNSKPQEKISTETRKKHLNNILRENSFRIFNNKLVVIQDQNIQNYMMKYIKNKLEQAAANEE